VQLNIGHVSCTPIDCKLDTASVTLLSTSVALGPNVYLSKLMAVNASRCNAISARFAWMTVELSPQNSRQGQAIDLWEVQLPVVADKAKSKK
jgi:hypothetical protein